MNNLIPRITFREIEDCEYFAELLLTETQEIHDIHASLMVILHQIPAQLRGFIQLEMGFGTSPRDLHEFITRHNERVLHAAEMTTTVVKELRRLRAEKGVPDLSDAAYDARFEKIAKQLLSMNEI